MAYNIDERSGIALRTARAPRGPWSSPIVIFDPDRDRGYGAFMHGMSSAVGFDDGLSERGREEEWACEYGPYLVPRWFEGPAPGVVALVYAMSTWNPYQVQLMRTWVAEAGVEWAPPVRARAPSASAKPLVNACFERGRLDGWKATGDAFATWQRRDGSWELTTYVDPAGDAATGSLSQTINVPANVSELRCVLSGGTESIRLVREGEVVRESRGPGANDAERLVRWRIQDYRGESLTIEIVDESTQPWGFLTVRAIELLP